MSYYRITYDMCGRPYFRTYRAESEGEALELFDLWADGLDEYVGVLSIVEIESCK